MSTKSELSSLHPEDELVEEMSEMSDFDGAPAKQYVPKVFQDNVWFGVVMTLLVLLALLLSFKALLRQRSAQLATTWSWTQSIPVVAELINPSPSAQAQPSVSPMATARPVFINGWWITDTRTDQKIVELKSPTDPIVKWQGKLWFASPSTSRFYLSSYDLATGQRQEYLEKESETQYLWSLSVLNDELYVSISGYFEPGNVYYFANPDQDPRVITQLSHAKLEQFNDRHWFVGGDGDGCGGFATYNRYYPETHTTTFVAKSNLGCAEGEQWLGIDEDDRAIMIAHEGYDVLTKYLYIKGINIDNPNQFFDLLTREEMPAGIQYVQFDEATNQVYLVGDRAYVFDIGSRQLKDIGEFLFLSKIREAEQAGQVVQSRTGWSGAVFCAYVAPPPGQPGETYDMQVDFATQTINLQAECKDYLDTNRESMTDESKELNTLFEKLDLEDVYELDYFLN